MAVDEKEKCCLADLSVPGAAIKSMCPVTALLESGLVSRTSWKVWQEKLQVTAPDVHIVGPMTDGRYVEMANDKLVVVKQKSCSVKTALHTIWGPVVMDPVGSYAVLPGKEDVAILGSPTLVTLGISLYDSLGKCTRNRNFSV